MKFGRDSKRVSNALPSQFIVPAFPLDEACLLLILSSLLDLTSYGVSSCLYHVPEEDQTGKTREYDEPPCPVLCADNL